MPEEQLELYIVHAMVAMKQMSLRTYPKDVAEDALTDLIHERFKTNHDDILIATNGLINQTTDMLNNLKYFESIVLKLAQEAK